MGLTVQAYRNTVLQDTAPYNCLVLMARANYLARKAGMSADSVKLGIVGLGRWANATPRPAPKSEKWRIVAGYSRSEEKRLVFEQDLGVRAAPDMNALL